MSDYTPDLSEAQSYYVTGRAQLRRQITGDHAIDITEYPHEFDRMIAAVERAAAEKAWNRCINEMPIDPDWKNFYGDNNPYRKGQDDEGA